MLKNNIIKLETKSCRKKEHYKSLGYDISSEFIEIDIKHLTPGSREKIIAICDFCNKEVEITYKEYFRNISIGNRYACSKYCGSLKAKETNKELFGVDHPMQLREYLEKAKRTNLERYGVEYLQQSKEIKESSKKTLREKWGVDHISKSDYFKNKVKKTCLENNGVEYPMMSDKIKNKSRKTLLENYGVDNPSKSKEIIEKVKLTNLEKYGNENYLLTNDFNVKYKEKLKYKWNCDNIMKSELYRKDKFSITKDDRYIKYLFNGISKMICKEGHEFDINIDNYIKRINSNLPTCTVCYPVGDKISIKENQVYEFIKSIYKGEIIQSYRDGLEIDIYLPDLKLGFEFNGLYWHSELYKERNYHLNKTNHFKERGIKIIHIWEDDWLNKNDILKSQIKNWLCLTKTKIYARNCEIREIFDPNMSRKFLNDNHIQGYVPSTYKIGLYYEDELLSLMIFDKYEGRKKMCNSEWNLSRFCSKINFVVIGGFSKLLNYFLLKKSPTRIISYADRSWSTGYVYEYNSFYKVSESKPDYKYLIDNKRVHKSKYKKSNLKTDMSEFDYMNLNGYIKVWDCGKIKYEKIF